MWTNPRIRITTFLSIVLCMKLKCSEYSFSSTILAIVMRFCGTLVPCKKKSHCNWYLGYNSCFCFCFFHITKQKPLKCHSHWAHNRTWVDLWKGLRGGHHIFGNKESEKIGSFHDASWDPNGWMICCNSYGIGQFMLFLITYYPSGWMILQ